jgi:hypothetical protein
MAKLHRPPSAPIRVLFIGNSFTHRNDMPGTLELLAAAASPSRVVHTERIIANGMALKFHLKIGEAQKQIDKSNWQFVVLQEQSTLPLKNRDRMHESITQFDALIREAGARTVLYVTWARRQEFERQAELTDAYMTIGKKLHCLIAPVGPAWQNALAVHPDLILHDKDNSHPNPTGSFLAACVFLATLLPEAKVIQLPPAALPKNLSLDKAESLLEIAIDTVKATA